MRGFRTRSRDDGRNGNRPKLPAFTTADPVVGYQMRPEAEAAPAMFCRACSRGHGHVVRVSDLFDDQVRVACFECRAVLFEAEAVS